MVAAAVSLGMQLNELPVLVAVYVLGATLIAAGQSDLGSSVGLAGLGVAALTLAGLVVLVRRALHAQPVVRAALEHAFGPQWTSAPGVLGRQRRPWLRCTLAPLAVRRRDVVHTRNVSYGPAGRDSLLDLYQPRTSVSGGPCLVYFHGGGYRSGTKNREARALLYRLASHGWTCASANYRLARSARYPDQLVDAKRAIAWMRTEAATLGADAQHLFVAGSSAGAHLAAMAALTENHAALQPGFEHADTSVAGAICLYGFYTSPSWVPRDPAAPSVPIEQLYAAMPPMLVVHGGNDSFVHVQGPREFVARARTVAPRTPIAYAELPGAQHTFDLYLSLRFCAVVDGVEAFSAGVMSAVAPARDSAPTSTRTHLG